MLLSILDLVYRNLILMCRSIDINITTIVLNIKINSGLIMSGSYMSWTRPVLF